MIPCDIVIGPPGPPEVLADGLGGLSGEPPSPPAVYVDILPDINMEIPESGVLVVPISGLPGASGGTQEVFAQPTAPVGATEPYIWIQTDVDGDAEAVWFGGP